MCWTKLVYRMRNGPASEGQISEKNAGSNTRHPERSSRHSVRCSSVARYNNKQQEECQQQTLYYQTAEHADDARCGVKDLAGFLLTVDSLMLPS